MEQNIHVNKVDFKILGKRRVLVAEDVEINQFLARQILESWGFEVMVVGNGLEAFRLAESDQFDCILMDVQMPEMDGIEATKRIRQLCDVDKSKIPIIALTAHTLKENRDKYLAAGMNDFLPKPIEEKKLFQAISRNLLGTQTTQTTGFKMETKSEPNMENNIADTKLYDLAMVNAVSGGDTDFIKKMVALFIETVPQNIQELDKGAQTENWDQVRKMAHKLKSTIDSMGIQSLHDDIRVVEANAKQKESLQEIPALVLKIKTVIDNCIGQLQSELN